MSDRRDYYFKQKVTENELDEGFDTLEVADRNMMGDQGIEGIHQNADVTERGGGPNLSVDVAGPGVIYDQVGQRVAWTGTQNVDVSVDELAAATTVVTPGNSKWLSIFAAFDRELLDPRTDGGGGTVFFVRNESFALNVVQGAEDVAPVRPPLRADEILLGDVLIVHGQTQVVNGDLDFTRREDAYVLDSGLASEVRENQLKDALQGIMDRINAAFSDVVPAEVADSAPANGGVSTELSRADHAHAHGDRLGGSLHAEVVAFGDAGFMNGTDKGKLNQFQAPLILQSAGVVSTTTSLVDVVIPSLGPLLLPVARYLLWFNADVDHDTNGGEITTFLYIDGVQQAGTGRIYRRGAGQGDTRGIISFVYDFTLPGPFLGDVEVRWSTNGGTASIYNRIALIYRVPPS